MRVIRVSEIWVNRMGPRKTCRDLQGNYRKQGEGYGRQGKGYKEPRKIRHGGMLGLGILGDREIF